jgi:hypothetical protein
MAEGVEMEGSALLDDGSGGGIGLRGERGRDERRHGDAGGNDNTAEQSRLLSLARA